MSEILSFPGLGWEIPINRVAFNFFSLPIYWYGIMFALAFLLGAIYVLRRHRLFGVDEDRMIDVLLGAVVGGVIGARIYYVAFSWDTYRDNLWRIFSFREGGIAMYGSIIGAVLAILVMCRWRKVKMLPLLDLFAGGLILGQAIGRWGNFFNMEAFGTNTDLPWGMTSNTISNYLAYHQESLAAVNVFVDPAKPVHPTFLYESIWCLLGFLLLFWVTKRRRYDGEMTLIYFGWYGLGRFFIEGLRTDSLMMGSLRVSQLVAALCVVASLVMMLLIRRKIKASDDPDCMKLYVDTEEGQAILAGTFYPKKEKKKAEDEETADKDTADGADNKIQTDQASDEDAPKDEAASEADDAPDSDKAIADEARDGTDEPDDKTTDPEPDTQDEDEIQPGPAPDPTEDETDEKETAQPNED